MKNNTVSSKEFFVKKVKKHFRDCEQLIERAINKANDETAERILKRGWQEACWSALLAIQKVEVGEDGRSELKEEG